MRTYFTPYYIPISRKQNNEKKTTETLIILIAKYLYVEDENYTPRLKMVGKNEKKNRNNNFIFVLVVEHNYSKTRKVYEQKTAPTYK